MKIIKGALVLVIFTFLVLQFVLFWPKDLDVKKNRLQKSRPMSPSSVSDDVEQDMIGVHLIEAEGESKEWELWANQATSYRSQELWLLKKIKVNFITNDGGYFLVTGTKGKVYINSKDMEIIGNVVVRSQNGYRFKTQLVIYNSEKKTLMGPRKVQVTGPKEGMKEGLRMRGNSMLANLKNSDVNIKGNVRTSKYFRDDQKVYIKSQSALLNGKVNKAHFKGKVVLDADSLHVTGPEATFMYSKKSSKVESVLMGGGVKVSDLDKWATSETLEAFFSENKFVFKGNPRVVQDADELRGEKIVFLNGGEQVRVLKAKAKVDKNLMKTEK